MATILPIAIPHLSEEQKAVSRCEIPVAGIRVNVFGLSELAASDNYRQEVVLLQLLHPRGDTAVYMENTARKLLADYYADCATLVSEAGAPPKGLIIASFDQRNHGERLVDGRPNNAWRQGNPMHAQDMYSTFFGTYQDAVLLMDFLPIFLFPASDPKLSAYRISDFVCAGVSLGAHSSWLAVVNEPRVTAACMVVGCADYKSVMSHRAGLSKLDSWHKTMPRGRDFIGSEHFPKGLVRLCDRYDASSSLLTHIPPTQEEIQSNGGAVPWARNYKLTAEGRGKMQERLGGKNILLLSGAVDKLVPYDCSAPFINILQAECDRGLFNYTGKRAVVKDVVFEGAGHEYNPKMAKELGEWFLRVMKDYNAGSHAQAALGPQSNL